MKNKFIQLSGSLLIVAAMMFHWSCKNDQNEDEGVAVLGVTPSVTEIIFSADGTSATADGAPFDPMIFTIETNQRNWYAASNKTWLQVLRVSNLNNYFTVSVKSVAGINAPETAELTIAGGKAEPVKIVVRQLSAAFIPATGLTVSPADLDMEIGSLARIRPKLLPANTNEEDVAFIWESSDPDIASVTDDGVVEAVSNGYATITVKMERDESIYAEIPVGVYKIDLINVVLGKNTTTSDITNNYPGSLAVDGILAGVDASRWVSADNSNIHWLEIDLAGTYTINRVVLYRQSTVNANQKMPRFCFQAWIDGAWVDVVCEESYTEDFYEMYFDEVTTTKVRLYTPSYSNNRVRLFEIEVYTPYSKIYE